MVHRAKHGFSFGENHITFGFFRCLKSEISRHDPDAVYIVSEGFPRHRHEISDSYKANRDKKKDTEFSRQLKDILDLCKFMPLTVARHPDFECDDVIGMLCSKFSDCQVTICSSDSDFIQLLDNPNISLWNPVKKKYIDQWPVDYCTWKSLKGDSSDNISGVKGVGEKTAFKLASDKAVLNEFFDKRPGTRNDFNKSMSLIKLANIDPGDSDLEIENFTFNEVDLFKSFERLSFKSIIGKSWDSWKNTMENLVTNDRTADIN